MFLAFAWTGVSNWTLVYVGSRASLRNQPIADPCLAGYDSNDRYMHVGDLVSGMNRDAHTNVKRPKSQIRSG